MSGIKFNVWILKELDVKDGCCCYCGRRMNKVFGHPCFETIDHVYPRANGGTNYFLNRLPCCLECNRMKADNSLEYFLEQVFSYWENNIGGSKNRSKRYIHMMRYIFSIKALMLNYKSKIYKYKIINQCKVSSAIQR